MSDKSVFGVSETGTYSTDSPNPHVNLAGLAAPSQSVAQTFSNALSSADTMMASIVKDAENWAIYRRATFTTGTPSILDLSSAVLLESKGTLANTDSVTIFGLDPGIPAGMDYARVYRAAALTTSVGWQVFAMDTVSHDPDGLWDDTNAYFVPKKPGYYLVNLHFRLTSTSANSLAVYKDGVSEGITGPNLIVNYGCNAIGLVYCNGTTNYLQFGLYTGTAMAIVAGPADCYMAVMGPVAI